MKLDFFLQTIKLKRSLYWLLISMALPTDEKVVKQHQIVEEIKEEEEAEALSH